MKFILKAAAIIYFLMPAALFSQQYASIESGNKLILDNGIITRVILLGSDKGGIVSTSMKLKQSKSDFLGEGSPEFSFEADGKSLTGEISGNLLR